jgi:hypothetical protein
MNHIKSYPTGTGASFLVPVHLHWFLPRGRVM